MIQDDINSEVHKSLSNNLLWFKNYRILVIQKRNNSSNAVQYADVELFGYYY